jgi:hypothetical protein
VALRIRKEGEGEFELGDLCRRYDGFAAELFGFLQVSGGVVDLDVKADLAGASVLGGADATADTTDRSHNILVTDWSHVNTRRRGRSLTCC